MKLIIDIDDNVFTRLFDNGVDTSSDDREVIDRAVRNGMPYEIPQGDMISREALKEAINKIIDEEIKIDEKWTRGLKYSLKIIDNAPAVEEIEKPSITECRNTAIEKNLPLYFVYYEETGIFEVYITETKELFEKRHCSKHLSNNEFTELATRYLDDYSDWKGSAE